MHYVYFFLHSKPLNYFLKWINIWVEILKKNQKELLPFSSVSLHHDNWKHGHEKSKQLQKQQRSWTLLQKSKIYSIALSSANFACSNIVKNMSTLITALSKVMRFVMELWCTVRIYWKFTCMIKWKFPWTFLFIHKLIV